MRWTGLLILFFSTVCAAESSVWKVTKGGSSLFLGGTIHMLLASDYPLPMEFNEAYRKADKLVFETDIAAIQDVNFQLQMLQRLSYSDGSTLKDNISYKAYAALEKYSNSRGMQVALFNQFKPPMAALTLITLELQRLGFTSTGVDAYFYKLAQTDAKSIGELESIDTQLNFIVNMGKGREDELILNTVHDMEQLDNQMQATRSAWRSGDLKKLDEVAVSPMRKDYPGLYQNLLVKRNNNWIPVIEAMLKTQPTEFVLVGVAHLVGRDGVIHKLRKRGYLVTRY